MKRILSAVLLAGLMIPAVQNAVAQVAIPVFSFSATGTNGASPEASLTLGPDGNFYGTTETGGAHTNGTIFRVSTSGVLTTLVNFNGANGANPLSRLTLGPDGNFYGTTEYGGGTFGNSSYSAGLGDGTIFQMTTNGTLTTIVSFNGANGSTPYGGVIVGPGGFLYGTTGAGGAKGNPYGTAFKVTTSGMLTTLTNFDSGNGANPHASLTLGPDGNFYGTTESGGTNSAGTLFQMTPSGVLTTLYAFGGTATNGADPETALVVGPGGNLYGTTSASGVTIFSYPPFVFDIPSGNGTIYEVTTNGGFTTLVDFDDYSAGATPNGTLAVGPDNNLYGTTYTGGTSDLGTLFEATTNGTLTTLVSFSNTNGAYPLAGLTLGADHNFYGGTTSDGSGGNGTIFVLGLPPEVVSGPVSESVIIGNPATFSAQVFGSSPLALQWLSNNIPVNGATGTSLRLASVFAPANNAQIQLAATNVYGSVTSAPATLTVVFQPNSYGITNDGGGSYTIFVGSTPNTANSLYTTTNLALPMAQWQLAGTIMTDATGMGQLLDTNTAGEPCKFYRLSYP